MKYLVVDNEGRRLCYDFKFRGFANFGTLRSCVKFYLLKHFAISRAKRASERRGAKVLALCYDVHIDAAGNMWQEIPVPGKEGYHDIKRLNWRDLIIFDTEKTSVSS